MTDIWIVTLDSYDYSDKFLGAFTTEQKAEEYKQYIMKKDDWLIDKILIEKKELDKGKWEY
jgi:ABC-type taurine transport system substrate-binding protein